MDSLLAAVVNDSTLILKQEIVIYTDEIKTAIDEFLEKLRPWMLPPVPFFIIYRIIKAKISAEIDHLRSEVSEFLDVLYRHPMGQAQKEEIAFL